MNTILFRPGELRDDGRITLRDGRARHIADVLHGSEGQVLRAGVLEGPLGDAEIERLGPDGGVDLRFVARDDAPPPLPRADLILALPRPKCLKRLWPQLAALGLGRIALVNAARVEAVYFATHWLQPERYEPLLIEGLCQAGDTRLPAVIVRRRLKPFVEDELDTLFEGDTARLLAHPDSTPGQPPAVTAGRRFVLAVGPEGGWTPYELELFANAGFSRFGLGSRVLRSDTACIALLGALSLVVAR